MYSQLDKASTPSVTGDGRKAIKSMVLRKGSYQDVYVARPTGTLPSWTAAGDVMIGSVVLDKDVKAATAIQLSYTIPPKSNVKKAGETTASEKKDDDKSLDEVIFESKVDYLSKIRKKDRTRFVEMADDLKKENSTNTALLTEILSFAKEGKPTNASQPYIQDIRVACDNFFADNGGPIDESALAQYFGVALPTEEELQEDEAMSQRHKEMVEQKKIAVY